MRLTTVAICVMIGLAPCTGAIAQQPSLIPFGAIEIGSKGVKSLRIEFDPRSKECSILDERVKKTINVTLNELDLSDPKHPRFADATIRETIDAVRQLRTMLIDSGIPPEQILIAISSGVANAENLPELKRQLQQLNGNRPPEQITAFRELGFGLRGLLSREEMASTILIDIGSGNIKSGYYQEETEQLANWTASLETGVPGTIEVAKMVETELAAQTKPNGASTPESEWQRRMTLGATIRQRQLSPKLKLFSNRYPFMRSSETVVMIGGATWAMTTVMYPDRIKSQRVEFSSADIREFMARVEAAKGGYPTPRWERIDQLATNSPFAKEDLRSNAQSQLKAVFKTFTPEQLHAAALILLSSDEQFRFDQAILGKKRTLVFDRAGLNAWMFGMVRTAVEQQVTRQP
ncbi:hypothetical protein [Tuwongella immobilis]|uniref:Tetratricopeptide repeat domain protein n=1 Tax=Tuwongella immobilis TaxID=692036 RepID=A0A6C2YSE9_9BACT|nr:hypothetical protein [Tuwongella immobilis]VIP04608.1 Tetratricopeptide repeat domain protein OS=Sulfurihydrogenibium yellowstonense SS-5 GN=SULYE_1317 PE=4 SV=1 [Tuwongella immobilis]VTS06577.1 Tetratricopeptide repeat domain protein OS=Sulfurihydrogenibium yellowstonense SS-5 GN=SULYE_1317 PE=4 SV=1 [Tuwongella immobilis]